jgi:DNA-binding NtrC family response regulator
VIERSVIMCETENFSVDETWLPRQSVASESKSQSEFSQKLASQEKETIESALQESEGRVIGPSGAAAMLGMPRSTVQSKIPSLKINKNGLKSRAGMPSGRSWFESVSMTPLRANGAA